MKLTLPTKYSSPSESEEKRKTMKMPEPEGKPEPYLTLVKKDAPFHCIDLLGVHFYKYVLDPNCFREGYDGPKEPQHVPILLTRNQADALLERAKETKKKRCLCADGKIRDVVSSDWIIVKTVKEYQMDEMKASEEIFNQVIEVVYDEEEEKSSKDALIDAQLKKASKK